MKHLALVLLASLTVGTAYADDSPVPVKKVAEPIAIETAGRALDVHGIRIGMSLDDATKVLMANCPVESYHENKVQMNLTINGLRVSSEPYINEQICNATNITIYYTPPSVGSVVYQVDSDAFYRDAQGALTPNSPARDLTEKALIDKYGPASVTQPRFHQYYWFFDANGKPVPAGEQPAYGVNVPANSRLVVSANMNLPNSDDPSPQQHLMGLAVSLTSSDLKNQGEDLLRKELIEAGKAKDAQSRQQSGAPSL